MRQHVSDILRYLCAFFLVFYFQLEKYPIVLLKMCRSFKPIPFLHNHCSLSRASYASIFHALCINEIIKYFFVGNACGGPQCFFKSADGPCTSTVQPQCSMWLISFSQSAASFVHSAINEPAATTARPRPATTSASACDDVSIVEPAATTARPRPGAITQSIWSFGDVSINQAAATIARPNPAARKRSMWSFGDVSINQAAAMTVRPNQAARTRSIWSFGDASINQPTTSREIPATTTLSLQLPVTPRKQ